MSNSYNKPRSCTSRLFGTLFAFIAAAAVVYVGCYLVIFHMTGLPAANETGWLGPKLRFLATGPYQDTEGGSFYRGDTKPYEVFKAANTLWLKTKDLPTTAPVAPEPEAAGGEARGEGEGEGRRGRGGRSAMRGGNERLDDGSTTATETGSNETTGSAEDRPRRRGRRGAGAGPDGATTETLGATESAGEPDADERPRRRGGRPPQNAQE